jgi:tRNA-dihydrouridine synthase
MAGITNAAFRRLCREHGAGVYVSEMITSRALVERDPETLRMITFDADESPRSLQLYGVDPEVVAAAVSMVVDENLADHVGPQLRLPRPEGDAQGWGLRAALQAPAVRAHRSAAVDASRGEVPVTVKLRKGIDEATLTYLDAGRIAEAEGAAWVALHGRTAAQGYSGTPTGTRSLDSRAP